MKHGDVVVACVLMQSDAVRFAQGYWKHVPDAFSKPQSGLVRHVVALSRPQSLDCCADAMLAARQAAAVASRTIGSERIIS
jgi:hypothetical protein